MAYMPSLIAHGQSDGDTHVSDLRSLPQIQYSTYILPHGQDSAVAGLPIVGRAADMTFSITPYGVQAYVPIIECSSGTYADLYWSNDNERDFHQRRGFLLCLEKHLDAHAKPSSCHASYIICDSERISYYHRQPHMMADEYIMADGQITRSSWQTILIRHRPPPFPVPGQLADSRAPFIPAIPIQFQLDALLRLNEASFQNFMRQCWSDRMEVRNATSLYPSKEVSHLPTTYVFHCTATVYYSTIIIAFGKCYQGLSLDQPHPLVDVPAWATVRILDETEPHEVEKQVTEHSKSSRHCCGEDHIERWLNLRKTFDFRMPYIGTASVVLSFTPCTLNPQRTLILDASFHYVWSRFVLYCINYSDSENNVLIDLSSGSESSDSDSD